MYGVIFDFLREYVIERHGGIDTWQKLLKANNHSIHKIYFPVTEYADKEMIALAKAASEELKLPLALVLEDFGSFTGKKVVEFYHMYIKDESWKTFDIIEHAGRSIHGAIHRHNPLRKPPTITAERISSEELIIHYHSHRRLCPVVRGIVRGLGERYGELFRIKETQCMHRGAAECIIQVQRMYAVGNQ